MKIYLYLFLTPSLHQSLWIFAYCSFFFIKSCKTNVEWFGGKGFNGAKINCGIVRI